MRFLNNSENEVQNINVSVYTDGGLESIVVNSLSLDESTRYQEVVLTSSIGTTYTAIIQGCYVVNGIETVFIDETSNSDFLGPFSHNDHVNIQISRNGINVYIGEKKIDIES